MRIKSAKYRLQGVEVLLTWSELLEWDNKRLEYQWRQALQSRAFIDKLKFEDEMIARQKMRVLRAKYNRLKQKR